MSTFPLKTTKIKLFKMPKNFQSLHSFEEMPMQERLWDASKGIMGVLLLLIATIFLREFVERTKSEPLVWRPYKLRGIEIKDQDPPKQIQSEVLPTGSWDLKSVQPESNKSKGLVLASNSWRWELLGLFMECQTLNLH